MTINNKYKQSIHTFHVLWNPPYDSQIIRCGVNETSHGYAEGRHSWCSHISPLNSVVSLRQVWGEREPRSTMTNHFKLYTSSSSFALDNIEINPWKSVGAAEEPGFPKDGYCGILHSDYNFVFIPPRDRGSKFNRTHNIIGSSTNNAEWNTQAGVQKMPTCAGSTIAIRVVTWINSTVTCRMRRISAMRSGTSAGWSTQTSL